MIRNALLDLNRSPPGKKKLMTFSRILNENKNIFLAYNRFRRRIFSRLAPRDSEVILYQLPWMLSVNHPSVPGYIADIKHNFRVFNIETEREILKRESLFKKRLNIRSDASILKPTGQDLPLEGLYTIGSVGTISQTPSSDCDLWLCINRTLYDETAYAQLQRKVNRIQAWMDGRLKMPVHFFLCDVEDVRNCNFGSVDYESCGSTQKKVLKEEFYRTAILIGGKIPLWWVCYDPRDALNYEEVAEECRNAPVIYYDLLDLGNLDCIGKEESIGAALWQLNKSLTHPLKSILKMLLLKMFLESPTEDLLCHRYRRTILTRDGKPFSFVDPSAFTLTTVMDHARGMDSPTREFILKCFYLRYEIKLYDRIMTFKEEETLELFRKFKLERKTIYELNRFSTWDFASQLRFGKVIFKLLVKIYQDIAALALTSDVAPRDLTIIGRKLTSSLKNKANKTAVLLKPMDTNNLPSLTIRLHEGKWRIFPGNDSSSLIVENADLVRCLSYLAWNGLYSPGLLRMLPNSASVTLQEIIDLAGKIREVFGIYDISAINYQNFLQPECVEKLLVITNFACSRNAEILETLSVITQNNWGELFVYRFLKPEKFISFLDNMSENSYTVEKFFHVQRNTVHYRTLLEKTQHLVTQCFTERDERTINGTNLMRIQRIRPAEKLCPL